MVNFGKPILGEMRLCSRFMVRFSDRVLSKDALAHLAKRYAELSTADKKAVDLSGQGVWDEQMYAAGLANDAVAFRVALEG